MKKIIAFICCLLSVAAMAQPLSYDSLMQNHVTDLYFTENNGQLLNYDGTGMPSVKYYGRTGQFSFFLKNRGITYQQDEVIEYEEIEKGPMKKIKRPKKITSHTIQLEWVGANFEPNIMGEEELSYVTTYYTHAAPDTVLESHNFKKLTYQEVYPNIDVVFYTDQGKLKYDMVLKPGADLSDIRFKFKGAKAEVLEDGRLLLKNKIGGVTEPKPIAFQNGNQLIARWIKTGNELSFEVDGYDPNQTLTIDPLVVAWSNTQDYNLDEEVAAIASDGQNSVYLLVNTNSIVGYEVNGIAQNNSRKISGESFFIMKLDENGLPGWKTFFDGDHTDLGRDLAVDDNGNCYVVGETKSFLLQNSSGNSPEIFTTSGTYRLSRFENNYDESNVSGLAGWTNQLYDNDPKSNEETTDGFLMKIDVATGYRTWGTFFGGERRGIWEGSGVLVSGYELVLTSEGNDEIESVSIDVNGNAVVTGRTTSDNNISYGANVYKNHLSGASDAFMAIFNQYGVRTYATYIGGDQLDFNSSTIVNNEGEIYVVGETNISQGAVFGTVQGARSANTSNGFDVFITKFASNGTFIWSRLLGGMGHDSTPDVCVDDSNNVYVVGTTGSYDFETKEYQDYLFSNVLRGAQDAFVTRISPDGLTDWSTYYGGIEWEKGVSCTYDSFRNEIVVSGTTTSSEGILDSEEAIQVYSSSDGRDVFLAKFCLNGKRKWGTYLGTDLQEKPNAYVTVSTAGAIYVGYTSFDEDPDNQTYYPGRRYDDSYAAVLVKINEDIPGCPGGPGTGGGPFGNTIPVDNTCENCLPGLRLEGDKYFLSVWVKDPDASATTTTYTTPRVKIVKDNVETFGLPSGNIIDGWQRIEVGFEAGSQLFLEVTSGRAYFDDLRLYPKDGSMKSYVYDPKTLRLWAELDERNYATFYEYDEEGKLVRIKKETEKGVMTIQENRSSNAKFYGQ